MKHQSLWEYKGQTWHWLTHAQAGDKTIQCKRQEKWSIYNLFTPLLKIQLKKKNHSQACQIFKTLTMTGIDMNRTTQPQTGDFIPLWHDYVMRLTPPEFMKLQTCKLQRQKTEGQDIITIYIINPWQQATSLECGKQQTSSALAWKSCYTCIKCGTLSDKW